jgi:rfaE bifunctional protein nucleotidyltransferase chain/domain
MKARDKIKSADELCALCMTLRQKGARLVFTNGCFDLLHVGHVRYLEAARELGDVLLVALNSDASVRSIKGALRPLVAQEERSEIVAALQCVDYVTVFDDPDPLATIRLLRPDILVKGADWPVDKIIGADLVQHYGGQVVRVPLVPQASTTGVVERILARYCEGAADALQANDLEAQGTPQG